MHSHRTALSFVDWSSDEFAPRAEDRFSSHAPFHFDLSILHLYVSIKHGPATVLLGEALGKQPPRPAPVAADQPLTVWCSTPSFPLPLTDFVHPEAYDLLSPRP